MCAEEGRFDADVAMPGECARGAQHLELVVGRQAVTRLDLDRRDAFGDQGVETGERARDQLGLAGLARRAHRRDDAAAGAGDLFVTGARKPHRPLVGAVAAVDEVGVAIDQAGVISRPSQSWTFCAVAGAPSAGPA